MFLYLIQDQMLNFRQFGGEKKFQPKKSLNLLLHQALQLFTKSLVYLGFYGVIKSITILFVSLLSYRLSCGDQLIKKLFPVVVADSPTEKQFQEMK